MDIQQQKLYKVLLIGDSCVDKYHFGKCERLSPEAPVPVLKLSKTELKPGMSMNVKENIDAFGVQVNLITNTNTITKERFIEERSGQQLLRLDTGENQLSERLDVANIDIKSYDCVAISDYDKGLLDQQNCLILSSLCKINNKPLFVDSKKKDLSCFENAIIKINESEKCKVKKYPTEYELVVTLGGNGAQWKEFHFPAEPTEVFDACGAGDTFFAAFVTEYMYTKNIMTSIIFANKCAARTVKKIGTHSLTREEIEDIRNDIRS